MLLNKKFKCFSLAILMMNFVSLAGVNAMSKLSNNINLLPNKKITKNVKTKEELPHSCETKAPLSGDFIDFSGENYEEYLKELESHYKEFRKGYQVISSNKKSGYTEVRLSDGRIRNAYKPVASFDEFEKCVISSVYSRHYKCDKMPLNVEVAISLFNMQEDIGSVGYIFIYSKNLSEFKRLMTAFFTEKYEEQLKLSKKQVIGSEKEKLAKLNKALACISYILDTVTED